MTLWLPTDLTSVTLEGWYRLHDVTGATSDGADLTYSSGTTVASWADQSGKGRTLQNEGTNNFNANGLSTGHCAVVAGASGFGGFRTAAAMAYPANAVIGAAFLGMMNTNGRGVSLSDGGNDYDTHGVIPISPSSSASQYWQNFATANSPTFAASVPVLMEGTPLSTTTADAGVNCVFGGTPCTINMSSLTLQRLGVLCAAMDASAMISGAMAEFILYAGVISAADHQKLQGYIAWNNGQQALLPSGHPYFAAAPTFAGGGGGGGAGFHARHYYNLNTRVQNV